MGDLDLSGEWAGTYEYPRMLAPVSFSASLTEQGGWLSGAIEEVGGPEFGAPRPLTASIQGRRVGQGVTWLKMYEERDVHHDVAYEGAVSADGDEIVGRWSIYGEWSGTFAMARKPQRARARERRATVDLKA